jgi:hypothetical protein
MIQMLLTRPKKQSAVRNQVFCLSAFGAKISLVIWITAIPYIGFAQDAELKSEPKSIAVQSIKTKTIELVGKEQLELEITTYANQVKVILPHRLLLFARPVELELLFLDQILPSAGHYTEAFAYDFSPSKDSQVLLRVVEGFVEVGIEKRSQEILQNPSNECEPHEWRALARLWDQPNESKTEPFLKKLAANVCVTFEPEAPVTKD